MEKPQNGSTKNGFHKNGYHKNNGFKNGIAYHPLIEYVAIDINSFRKESILLSIINFFKNILPSTVFYFLFLAMYGLNERLGMMPRFQDIGKPGFHIYNISAIEYSVLRFSPHKLISSFHFPLLDYLAATPYLLHYTLPVVYMLFLISKGQINDIKRFFWLLGWVLWCQFFIWWIFPTAPQWYYDNEQMFTLVENPPPIMQQHKEGCAFHRIDLKTGGKFFFKMFNQNPIPFGAFPSGHVMWPFCIFVTNPPFGKWFLLYVGWVSWATLYSCHHYLSDVVGAIMVVLLVKRLIVLVQPPKYEESNDKELSLRRKLIGFFRVRACPYEIV